MSPSRHTVSLCCALAALGQHAEGFASPSGGGLCGAVAPRPSTSCLHERRDTGIDSGASLLLSRAGACAGSDECSLEEAETYLRDVIRIQSGCAAGTLSGEFVCGDVGYAAGVVADLRSKISEGAKSSAGTFWDKRQEEFEDLVAASVSADGTGLSPTASLLRAPIKPAYLALAALYAMMVISSFNPDAMQQYDGIVPFTPQEVWWSVRDGYFDDLLSQMLQHGGLSIADATSPSLSLSAPLSLQEVCWSVRDGYVGDLFSHMYRNGGLSVGDIAAAQSQPSLMATSLRPEEVWWSVRDGYAPDLLSHAARNGGLAVGDGANVDQFRMTSFRPDEIWWAVRDGYATDLLSHAMRNGGLRI